MEIKEFERIMRSYETKIGFVFQEEQIFQFYHYMNLLLEWNEKINLTAIIDPNEIILKHFIDSITIHTEIQKGYYLADIGTGAGFPGIPLKIIRPDINVVLIDSLNKRIHFLNFVIEALGLKKIETIHARIEEIGKNKQYREKFDVVTSRAVANLAVLSEYMLPLVKIGGKSIAMKGSEIEEELEQSQKAITLFGGKIEKVKSFCLPMSEMKRNVVLIKKEKKTPSHYPRKAGTPSKEPIV